MYIGVFDWSLVGLFCGCVWGVYVVIKGIRTGVVTARINHRSRTFYRGERYFIAVLIMHSLLVMIGLCMGTWLLWSQYA